jgi:hypothetical protein
MKKPIPVTVVSDPDPRLIRSAPPFPLRIRNQIYLAIWFHARIRKVFSRKDGQIRKNNNLKSGEIINFEEKSLYNSTNKSFRLLSVEKKTIIVVQKILIFLRATIYVTKNHYHYVPITVRVPSQASVQWKFV